MSSIRLWHNYIGIFIAPSVIFFALTGALQIFSLHEAHGSYEPPALIEKLSSVHKDQVFARKPHEEHDESGSQPPATAEHEVEHDEGPALGTVLLKWFFLFVALALATSTVLGLWIGLTHIQRKRTGRWLLLAGIVLPVTLYII
jgi:hypothetical protein